MTESFSEQSLRQAIINTWGPAGAHIDVYDALLAALATERRQAKELVEAVKSDVQIHHRTKRLSAALANYHKATGLQAENEEGP